MPQILFDSRSDDANGISKAEQDRSPMKKGHDTVETTKMKTYPGNTVTERFAVLPADAPALDVMDFLSLESAKLFASVGPDHRLKPEQEADLIAFYKAFMARYGDNRVVQTAIQRNRLNVPAILRASAQLIKFSQFPYDREVELNADQIRWRDSFLEHVLDYRVERILSFIFKNPDVDGKGYTSEVFDLPARIPEKYLEDAKNEVGEWFGFALKFGGSLSLRLRGIGSGGRDVLNGFAFSDGKVTSLPSKDVRAAYAACADGTDDGREEYRTAFWSAD